MNFSQSHVRFAGVWMRVVEGSMEEALSFFSLLNWVQVDPPSEYNEFRMSAGPSGFPVVTLFEQEGIDWGEVRTDECVELFVSDPSAALDNVRRWATSRDQELEVSEEGGLSCLFSISGVFISQIRFIHYR